MTHYLTNCDFQEAHEQVNSKLFARLVFHTLCVTRPCRQRMLNHEGRAFFPPPSFHFQIGQRDVISQPAVKGRTRSQPFSKMVPLSSPPGNVHKLMSVKVSRTGPQAYHRK